MWFPVLHSTAPDGTAHRTHCSLGMLAFPQKHGIVVIAASAPQQSPPPLPHVTVLLAPDSKRSTHLISEPVHMFKLSSKGTQETQIPGFLAS